MAMRKRMQQKGFSLIELLIVIAIVSALLAIGGFAYRSMQARYIVEREVREMHTDLMNARVRAMQNNRMLITAFTTTRYAIYEDTSPVPDGNGELDTAADRLVVQKSLAQQYPLMTSWPSGTFAFSSKGLLMGSQITGTVWLTTTAESEYDCIVVQEIKTTMGKWNGTQCIVK